MTVGRYFDGLRLTTRNGCYAISTLTLAGSIRTVHIDATSQIFFNALPLSGCLQNDVTLKNAGVVVGIDSPLPIRNSLITSPLARSTLSGILETKFGSSNSLLKSSISCLREILPLIPGAVWARTDLNFNPRLGDENLRARKLKIVATGPDVEQSSYRKSIRPAPLQIECLTNWMCPVHIDSIRAGVKFQISTQHLITQPLREEGDSTQTSTKISVPRSSEVADAFDHNVLFNLHRDVFQGSSIGEYEDVLDLSQRSMLSAFLLSDNSNLIFPLESVRIMSEHYRYNQASDQKNLSVSLGTLRLTNTTPSTASVHMNRVEYHKITRSAFPEAQSSNDHSVYVALGSNVGDRISMIEQACKSMEARGMKILRTSALYETAPMYLEDQPPFLNGACQVETSLSPSELLAELKSIENDLGRIKSIENGPRTIDLDILLYDDEQMQSENLTIPHLRISEREFVLRPLCDLIPDSMPPSVTLVPTFRDRLKALSQPDPLLSPLTPLSTSYSAIQSERPDRKTRRMAIMNLTPDSFSDGGAHPNDPSSLKLYLDSLLSDGANMLDIGGQSTRPNADEVTSEEEIARVLPTIEYIRSQPEYKKLILSIDTYRASVAEAAIIAGADIVNDVSAGTMDPAMLPLVARLGCTVILMHMRGTPKTMMGMTSYPNGIIEGVAQELLARVAAAEAAGVRRWRMILDPGIGFAKSQKHNIELLRRFGELRAYEGLRGIPWVVGASRKGFIGKITGVTAASERMMGTAATVCAAIQGGADIVRVHDVKEMTEVTKMANAIWRV